MFPSSDRANGASEPCMDCYQVFLGTGKPSKFGMICDGCTGHTHIKFRPNGICLACYKAKKVDNIDEVK